jgi:hypothetical protein
MRPGRGHAADELADGAHELADALVQFFAAFEEHPVGSDLGVQQFLGSPVPFRAIGPDLGGKVLVVFFDARDARRRGHFLFWLLAPVLLSAGPAFGQRQWEWNVSSGNWSEPSDWAAVMSIGYGPGGGMEVFAIPPSGVNFCLTNGPVLFPGINLGNITTTLDINATVGTLQVGSGNVLTFNNGQALQVNGPTINNVVTVPVGDTTLPASPCE